jgi:hypothetical protein
MQDQDNSGSKVNPITILVPNIKLETNNCHFSSIVKLIEAISQSHRDHSGHASSSNKNYQAFDFKDALNE